MKKATKILFSTALTAGMLFTGVQLWNLQAQEETSNKKEANTGITLQEAAATTTAKQNGDLLRKRDGSCLDENNTASNPNCDGTQQGKQYSYQNAADTNTAQNGNRLRKRDGSCLDENNTASNPNCDGTQQGKQYSYQNAADTNTAQNGNRLRKRDGSCLDGNNTANNPNGNGMRQRKQDGSANNPNCPRKNM
ncbi:hypothetical protein DW220_07590 [Eubacterium sp. AM18-26]|uniref:Uncharacterized protein n=1 Tax=Amedibacterium intestinale TaxID=2583452 RepID=A0A6N4TMV9_9FIRM|nr:hypothetical protein [Amedibacterium intestinale]RHO21189.1 hypothetical protein DW220_07590 [Eubacterium sp. AM18-26]RHO25391.1 hypothetical protein DW212_07655 [Eubacterium sp. AM18-10LB-B]BBK23804.1 hypothetical protein Aargi30884_27070 [Amedibacterium intestinale]